MATLADLLIKVGIDAKGVGKGAAGIESRMRQTWASVAKGADTLVPKIAAVAGALPAVGAGGVAVASLVSTFAAAGLAAGVFGGVLKSAQSDISESATKFEDLGDKIELYGEQAKIQAARGEDNAKTIKKQAAAMLELDARLALLPPRERAATIAFVDMRQTWESFVDSNKPATFGILEKGYKLIGDSVGRLQPFFDMGAAAAGRLLDKIQGAVSGGMLERMAASAGPALDTLTDILINVGTALSKTFGKIGTEQGQGFLNWLEDVTAKWAKWASATEQGEGINKFLEYTSDHGPAAGQALVQIAEAAMAVAKAVTPLAPVTLAIATALAALIAAIPPGVITGLVSAWLAWGIALKAWAVYQAIATAAQWAMNTALLANPITWIIIAIVALIAAIVLIATKTTWFQATWEAVWGFLKAVGAWFAGPFANFFVRAGQAIANMARWVWGRVSAYFGFWYGLLAKVKNWVGQAVGWIKAKFMGQVAFVKSLPGRISGALYRMWDGMKNGFRNAINYVISKWNSLQFTIPSFSILGESFGGGSIGTPNIPQLADGGLVKARRGGTLVNVGEGGDDEAVVPLNRAAGALAPRDERPIQVQIVPGGEREFRTWIKRTIRVKGPLQTTGAVSP